MSIEIIITYTNVLSINKDLRNINLVRFHPIANLLLVNLAHEHVALLELHHQRVQNFLHQLTLGVSGPDHSHARQIHDDFATVFVFVVLETEQRIKQLAVVMCNVA